MMEWLRGPAQRSELDHHLAFLNQSALRMEPNEIFLNALQRGFHKRAFALFPSIDWTRCDEPIVEAVNRWARASISLFAMDLLAQLHTVGWTQAAPEAPKELELLVRRMLEHRNYEFEEQIFEGRVSAPNGLSRECPVEIYVPYFFRDKELIKSVMEALGLMGEEEIFAVLDAAGHSWGGFLPSNPRYKVLSDISLFYAYRHLLLRTYHNGEGRYVGPIHLRSLETQARLRRSLPAPSKKLQRLLDAEGIELPDVKLLSPDWSALIGHNGHLNVHLMMRKMGWWRGSPLVLAYKDRIANKPFLSLFTALCPVWTREEDVPADVWHEMASLTPFLGVSHQAFAFEDGRAMYWNDAGAMALDQWEREGGGYPLRDIYDRRLETDDDPDRLLMALRQRWGMKPDDWYVCLHMRESAARGEKDGVGESIRNASYANYIDAIRHITDMGGWVVRMGSAKAAPLPEMRHLIDYARSPYQLPILDIHLVRRAKMFIGTTSGFAYVASSFGIPTAMVNAISSVGLLWSENTRFALKPVHTADGRMLSLRDVTSEEWRWTFPTHESVARARLTVHENTSDEILETVKEVLNLSEPSSTNVAVKNDAWKKSLSIPSFFGSSSPARYFLEKYANQLLTND